MIPPISGAIGPMGSGEWSVPSVGQLAQIDPNAQVGGSGASVAAGTSGSFGSTLTNAINSLEQTQNAATTASQQLATGQLSDPTQAVTAVENASLEMDFASQLENKFVGDAANIFSTTI